MREHFHYTLVNFEVKKGAPKTWAFVISDQSSFDQTLRPISEEHLSYDLEK